jgi:hypothetical protein
MDAATPLQGGEGVKRSDLAELKLFRLALAQGWSVPGEFKELAVQRCGEILREAKAGERSWLAAAKTLANMTGQTLAAIDTAIRARTHEEFEARLKAIEEKLNDHDQHQ